MYVVHIVLIADDKSCASVDDDTPLTQYNRNIINGNIGEDSLP